MNGFASKLRKSSFCLKIHFVNKDGHKKKWKCLESFVRVTARFFVLDLENQFDWLSFEHLRKLPTYIKMFTCDKHCFPLSSDCLFLLLSYQRVLSPFHGFNSFVLPVRPFHDLSLTSNLFSYVKPLIVHSFIKNVTQMNETFWWQMQALHFPQTSISSSILRTFDSLFHLLISSVHLSN